MDHLIPLMILLAKYLIGQMDNHAQDIKAQLCSPDNRLIEKCLSIVKKCTRVVFREDYENYKAFNVHQSLYNQKLNPQMPHDEMSFGVEDTYGNRHFNDIPPMYNFEDLEQMHDDPEYNIRLSSYKQRLEDRKNGLPVMDEEELKRNEEERKTKGLPGMMLATQDLTQDAVNRPQMSGSRQQNYQKYGFAEPTNQNIGQKERVDVDSRIRYLLQFPPKDSVILSRQHHEDFIANKRKDQLNNNPPNVNQSNLTKNQKQQYSMPQFTFPNAINEYEAFFNPIHSYIEEDGQIIQIDPQGEHVPRGYCFKPGSMMLKMTNQMRYIYVISLLILKKACKYFKQDVQKKALFLETQMGGRKTPNMLIQTLLFIAEKAELDKTVFPDFFIQIFQIEGDVNSMAADLLSCLLEHQSVVHFLMSTNDFTYQVLSVLKKSEEQNKQKCLLYLVKSVMLISQSPQFKLTMGSDKSIIEIYAYRILIRCFLEQQSQEMDSQNVLMLQYIVQTFISASRDSKFAFHLLQAIKIEKIDVIWRLFYFFSKIENSQIMIDVYERYYFEQIPIEIFVSFNTLVSKLAVSSSSRIKISQILFKIINSPVDDGSITPQPKPNPKDKKGKASPVKPTTPNKPIQLSKQKQKELKLAQILDEIKLDAYLKKLYHNLKYLYSYSGMTKSLFNDIKNDSPYLQNSEETYERNQEFVEDIKKGLYEECFNETDLDKSVGGPSQMMDQFKEAITGQQLFLFNDQSGLLLSNQLVLAKDIPNMFLKYAFEDSLKLIILKQMQNEIQERRQLQQQLLVLSNSESRLIDEKTCSHCKEVRALANEGYQQLIKFYFSKFIQSSFFISETSLASQQQQEMEIQQFDRNKILELKHIGMFQTILSFQILQGINVQLNQTKDQLELDLNIQQQLALVIQLIQTTVCGQNENLHPMDCLCFVVFLHKILQTNIQGQKANDIFLDFFINRNLAQISHTLFDILIQSLKNNKTTQFGLMIESFDNPANQLNCVIKSSKKGKIKITQNLKKETPSNPIYMIDIICIHIANHLVLTFIHILNQSRKKYLILIQKNVETMLEQSQLILSFYAQGTKLDQSLKKNLKRLCKSIITFYFATYEQFFSVFETYFAKLTIEKITEILMILKVFKNVKLANQILQIVKSIINLKDDINSKTSKSYQQLFKTLIDVSSNFIIVDVIRDLQKQCKDQIAFNNDKLSGEALKNFSNEQNSSQLQFKLGFCQIYFQLQILFLSTDESDNFIKQINTDIITGQYQSLSQALENYLDLINNSIEIDPVLLNFFSNFTEQLVISTWFLTQVPNFTQFLFSDPSLNLLFKSIKQSNSVNNNFSFSLSGLLCKITSLITDPKAFIAQCPDVFWVLNYIMEKDDLTIETAQFMASAIRVIAQGCPKDKLHKMRPLAYPLRQVLDQNYFKNSESYSSNFQQTDQERQAFVEEVKYVLSLLKPAETSEIQDANNKIISSKSRIIQGAGLMSISTLLELKNYESNRQSQRQSQTDLQSNKNNMFSPSQTSFNQSQQIASITGFNHQNNMVSKVDDEFQKIMEKYTPQRELDWLTIAKQSQQSLPPKIQPESNSLRKTQSVAQFYFYTDKMNKQY